jgi:hypothetical protein
VRRRSSKRRIQETVDRRKDNNIRNDGKMEKETGDRMVKVMVSGLDM